MNERHDNPGRRWLLSTYRVPQEPPVAALELLAAPGRLETDVVLALLVARLETEAPSRDAQDVQ